MEQPNNDLRHHISVNLWRLHALADLVGTAGEAGPDSVAEGTLQVSGIWMQELCGEIEKDFDQLTGRTRHD